MASVVVRMLEVRAIQPARAGPAEAHVELAGIGPTLDLYGVPARREMHGDEPPLAAVRPVLRLLASETRSAANVS